MVRRRHRLITTLWQAFVLQIVLISATAVAGVYLADFAIRELLIVSALEREADYFWARRKITLDTPAPNTNTLIGYVFDQGANNVPQEFAGLSPGIHDLVTPVGEAVVHVSELEGTQLFLVFDANNVGELATYFGVAPLALMLVVLYSSAWFAYGLTRRAVSPVIQLARSVRNIDLETPDIEMFADTYSGRGVDAEIESLANALQHLLTRVDQSIERERNFTREASHELRSPLTVIRMASDNLLNRSTLDDSARALTEKIRRAAQDMEELTEILLLLAREHEGVLAKEKVNVNEILRQEINRCRMIYGHKEIEIALHEHNTIHVHSSPKIVAIVFGNLLRNACAYTDAGRVELTLADNRVTLTDSGVGMSEEHLGRVFTPDVNFDQARGNGIGLSLVKRITERFDWEIAITSEPARGTRVEVVLPAVAGASATLASAAG